ncbi:MAG: hypothetical protein RLZ12_989, partial [Bacillota bacterium]
INLPSYLCDFAELNHECVILGLATRVEIWSAERWSKYYEDAEESFNAIAESIEDFSV